MASYKLPRVSSRPSKLNKREKAMAFKTLKAEKKQAIGRLRTAQIKLKSNLGKPSSLRYVNEIRIETSAIRNITREGRRYGFKKL